MTIASTRLRRLTSAVLVPAALLAIPMVTPADADAKPTKSMVFDACMKSDDNPDRDAVLKKCCDLIGGEVIEFPDGGKGCVHQNESTPPKGANPVVPVEPPTVESPTTTVIAPILPIQPPAMR